MEPQSLKTARFKIFFSQYEEKIFNLVYYLKFREKANFAHLERILHVNEEGEVDRLQNALLVQRVLHLFQFHHLKYILYFSSKI